jgi:hypothetical protein
MKKAITTRTILVLLIPLTALTFTFNSVRAGFRPSDHNKLKRGTSHIVCHCSGNMCVAGTGSDEGCSPDDNCSDGNANCAES